MAQFVSLVAPRSWWDFAFKFAIVMVLGNLLAMAVVYAVHGYLTSGLRGQIVETTIIAAPFVFIFLKIIAYLYELQSQLQMLAHTDVLTGLPNRRAFLERLERQLAAQGDGHLMLADADHFKAINDRFGHDRGDACLRAIAAHLNGVIGAGEYVARIGGEEFAVFTPESSPRAAAALGARIVAPIVIEGVAGDGRNQSVTLSAGGVRLDGATSPSQVMAAADRALYRAKSEGRARFVLADGIAGAPDDRSDAAALDGHAA